MIVFTTPGTLDMVQVTSFGTSVKEEGAIGFFGTGLKYALAVLMRLQAEVTIITGGKTYPVTTVTKKVRGKAFQFVKVGKKVAGFTTELGKTWEAWEAYRELESNTRDEGGRTTHKGDKEVGVAVEDNTTAIVVVGRDFEEVWGNRGDIFLDAFPLWETDLIEVHPGPGRWLYYKGIRAFTLDKPTEYTYNFIGTLELTENRTIANPYRVEMAARRAFIGRPIRDVLHVMTVPDGRAEHSWNWSYLMDEFPKDTILELLPHVKSRRTDLNSTVGPALLAVVRSMGSGQVELSNVQLDKLDQSRLERAITFLNKLGYPVQEYPIVVTDLLADGILGLAHEGKIYLSQRVFLQGTHMVAGTVLEEFIHLRHNLPDTSRDMQNYLMDTVIRMGERALGEAL